MSFNFRQLEAFRAVMVMGSATAAAKMLHVSQPGISRLISDLERAIGFRLFVRQKGRLRPTPEGNSFYEELERSFVGMERLRQTANEIRDMRRGHLHIAVMPAVSLDLMPDATERFLRDHEEMRLSIEVHASPSIVEGVATRQFDFGIAQLSVDQPGIDVLRSYRTDCVVVCPLDHPFAERDVIRPEDLATQGVVALAQHTMAAMQIDRAFENAAVRRRIRVETQPSSIACSMALRGLGVALVDPLTADFYGPRRLASRPFEPAIPFGFRVLQAADTISSVAVSAFIREIDAVFTAHPAVTQV
jgi:DNA-binding transcriptional LysR family regulator